MNNEDKRKIPNRHGKAGWCQHLSKRTATGFEFTSDDEKEVMLLQRSECVKCPYCLSRRPINL